MEEIINSLTEQEKMVCLLTLKGLSRKEIASRLVVEVSTIATHRRRIFRKLNCKSQIDLIRKFLMQEGARQ
jgi:DNA-binding NarL/FixJ family response regulator